MTDTWENILNTALEQFKTGLEPGSLPLVTAKLSNKQISDLSKAIADEVAIQFPQLIFPSSYEFDHSSALYKLVDESDIDFAFRQKLTNYFFSFQVFSWKTSIMIGYLYSQKIRYSLVYNENIEQFLTILDLKTS
jgi:hypothetical protein